MGLVTEHLRRLITKQVDDHSIVVWFDPEKHYQTLAAELEIPQTTIARYVGSFFALRYRIEPLLAADEPPRLVIYVPLAQADTHKALIEVETLGVVIKPGQQPPTRNTRLSIVARNALKPILGEESAAAIEKQVEAGNHTLGDLDRLADQGKGIATGVVSLIFGTGNPPDVALEFLSSERRDTEMVSKGAGAELAMLLGAAFEVDLPGTESPAEMRARLARHILATDLLASLQGKIPAPLRTVKIASRPAMRQTCATLARTWRLRRDLRDSYVARATRVAQELGLAGVAFEPSCITDVETFLETERSLQRGVEARLLQAATGEMPHLIDLAQSRQSSFWSENLPDVQAQWALIAVAGRLLVEAERIERELKSPAISAASAANLFAAYTEGDRPWCLLDTYHRHMERRYHNFDFDAGDRHQGLQQLIVKARIRYMEIGGALAEHFLRRYREGKFQLGSVLRQTEVFDRKVKPQAAEGKAAYVWVDALRFEMGRELAETLAKELELELTAAVAAVPTITEIGMAALLPGTESAKVAAAGDGKLGLEIDSAMIRDRDDRVNFLKAKAGGKVYDTKLESLLPSPKRKVEEGIRSADLILVTSQEIDDLGERDNIPLARRAMDGMLYELQRVVRVLGNLGVKKITIAADHGFLFGDELESDMKLDAPGGETADLHRRVWVGRGGRADDGYLRARLSDFALGGELEIAAPWGFACFKVKGGGSAYFHGGLSPQELAIPVIVITPKSQGGAVGGSRLEWNLTPGSQKISTRFFSVQVKGVASDLFDLTPPKVRVEIRARGESLSTPVSASYGFEEATGDVQLKLAETDARAIEPNTITLAITGETEQKSVTVYLLDAASGFELARLEKIEIAIAI
jgi:hypothetical protein